MASRKKHIWILVICILALAILIFFEPEYGWRLRVAVGEQNIISADDPTLPAQNQALQAQLAELQSIASELPQNSANDIPAMVYSQYPFGFKSQILVNAGSNAGVAVGDAAMSEGVFIGGIIQVFPEYSVVQTIFDPAFKMPVRIGSEGVDSLLMGGAYPKATSIAKSAAIVDGDIVYTAAAGYPYGLPIGVVNATDTSPDNLFQEASLSFAYDVNQVQTVLIAR